LRHPNRDPLAARDANMGAVLAGRRGGPQRPDVVGHLQRGIDLHSADVRSRPDGALTVDKNSTRLPGVDPNATKRP
jgi:hypothetical protein